MISDEDQDIRQLGLQKILLARTNVMSEDVRRFQVPIINFSAQNYTELISWESSQLTEPPILKDVSQETLSEFVATHDATLLEWNYPCHTQAVERAIKLVTEASASVCGSKERNGYIKKMSYKLGRRCLFSIANEILFARVMNVRNCVGDTILVGL